jgi:hypothetical protein
VGKSSLIQAIFSKVDPKLLKIGISKSPVSYFVCFGFHSYFGDFYQYWQSIFVKIQAPATVPSAKSRPFNVTLMLNE